MMLRKIIAPTLVLTFAITTLTILGINLANLAQANIEDQDYFIKFNPQSNVAIVEPNYGYFFHPDPEIQGDSSGENLYQALNEIKETYDVKDAKMVRFERKGYMIPNLYVLLKSREPQPIMAETHALKQS